MQAEGVKKTAVTCPNSLYYLLNPRQRPTFVQEEKKGGLQPLILLQKPMIIDNHSNNLNTERLPVKERGGG